jgi:hypothetical protein
MRQAFKSKWPALTDENKQPFGKKAHDHVAKHGMLVECITDACGKNMAATVHAHS